MRTHETTVHDFKSNIARYIAALEEGRYKAIIVRRYKKPVGIFMTFQKPVRDGAGSAE